MLCTWQILASLTWHPHQSATAPVFTSCPANQLRQAAQGKVRHPPVSGDTRFCSALILMAELMRCAASAAQLLLLLPMFQSLQTGGKKIAEWLERAATCVPATPHVVLVQACATSVVTCSLLIQ